MPVKERLSASVDAELLAAAQEAVAQGRAENLSAWVNEALRHAVERDRKLQAMDRFLAAYEAEHGVISDEEMAAAVRQARTRAVVVRGSARPTAPPEPAMTLILDAGAFVAVERGDRVAMALLKVERRAGGVPVTHGGVVGQVWRGGRDRQVPLARVLAAVDVLPLDDELGRRGGLLLALTGTNDVIDAALVLVAGDGDDILTSDVADLARLARAADVHVELIAV